MIKSGKKIAVYAAALVLPAGILAVPARAQLEKVERKAPFAPQPSRTAALKATNTVEDAGQPKVDVKADKILYSRTNGIIEARGNVVVTRGDQELRGDYVVVNVNTEDAEAFGNVVLRQQKSVWRGQTLKYNFKTGIGGAPGMVFNVPPFFVRAEKISRQGRGREFVGENVTLSTCSNSFSDLHYCVTAREAAIMPGDSIEARGTVFWLGPVPFFYLPYWGRDLNSDTGFKLRAGLNSRWGGFLLGGYKFGITPEVKGVTHLNYLSRRGVGVGQDILWKDKNTYNGEITGYYINDRKPLDDEDDPATSDIKNARWRILLRHSAVLTDKDAFSMQANYLSDTDIIEDFFESEFRQSSQPDNYAVFSHREDVSVFNLLARGRINDFYTQVNRLPEASLTFIRQPVEGTYLYYESQTALSSLQKVWEKNITDQEDYSAVRLDSGHMFYLPSKQFGFLNVMPRAGYRATYYSKTKTTETSTEIVQLAYTNAAPGPDGTTNFTVSYETRTNNVSRDIPEGAALRSKVETGLETSFKAFKTWGEDEDARRHVAEPYANYTLIPQPSEKPASLYQFDEVDALDKQHFVQIGMRNKYQKKRNEEPFDIIDLDIYTRLMIERAEGQKLLDDFSARGRWIPCDEVVMDLEATYSTAQSRLSSSDLRLQVNVTDWWQFNAEHRYVVDQTSLASAGLTLFPNGGWTYNLYGRYEMEGDARLQEQGGYIQRNLDCLSIRTGYSILPAYTRTDGTAVEQEYRFMVEFWLTAFPKMGLTERYGG